VNAYGESKLAGDRAILESGCAHLILRTSWIFAPVGKNFVLTMLRLGRTRKEFRVVNDQVGAPTSAEVVAAGTFHILSRGVGDLPAFLRRDGGVVNLTCDGESSWHAFALEILAQAREKGWPIAVESVIPISSAGFPSAARRPKNSRLSLDRLREKFDFHPPHWKEALRECLGQVRIENVQ
jgi:dTDP-4-dehydrorhamnose reductase